ncbi:MAG: HAMP domain-containing protein [Elusimicrobia bacterium]|nr:HAMP domain-containing protein [Elusimicrobiota bacterium]
MLQQLKDYLRNLVIRKKIFFLTLLLTLSLAAAISFALYDAAAKSLHHALRRGLRHTATTASLLIEGDLVERVRQPADRKGPAWQAVARRLMEVRDANKLRAVYVMRRSQTPGRAQFVVDPSTQNPTAVGQDYDLSRAPAMDEGFSRPSADADIVQDEFGAGLSGYAPVFRKDGAPVGLIGVDMDASEVMRLRRRFQRLAGGLCALFVLVSLFASTAFARLLTRPIVEMRDKVKLITSGRLEMRAAVESRDEIGQLAAAINRMIDTLSHYLPVKLVGQVLGSESDLKLGGSRMPVTAYFSDIAGSTTIAEKLKPEEVVGLLNEYLTAMSDIIEETGGTVDKYEGDAVMAFWGAPVEQADHAKLACEAALKQMKAIEPLRDKWKREGKPDVTFRVGLNSGDVIAGNMGSNRRFNYTIMGDVVNLASRLEGANKNYGSRIMLGETTRALAGDAFECRKLDRIRVVGKTIPVTVYELLGRKGEVAAGLLSSRDLFERALSSYAARGWDEAEKLFSEAARLVPGDGACALYLGRIAGARKDPPPSGWDGTHDLRSK